MDDLPSHVQRAGRVVVLGAGAAASLEGLGDTVVVRSRVPQSAPAQPASARPPPPAGNGNGLLRSARCGARALLSGLARPEEQAYREVVKSFGNTPALVFASGEVVELRVDAAPQPVAVGAAVVAPGGELRRAVV